MSKLHKAQKVNDLEVGMKKKTRSQEGRWSLHLLHLAASLLVVTEQIDPALFMDYQWHPSSLSNHSGKDMLWVIDRVSYAGKHFRCLVFYLFIYLSVAFVLLNWNNSGIEPFHPWGPLDKCGEFFEFYVSFAEVRNESNVLCPHSVLDAERYFRCLAVHSCQRRHEQRRLLCSGAIKTYATFGSNVFSHWSYAGSAAAKTERGFEH